MRHCSPPLSLAWGFANIFLQGVTNVQIKNIHNNIIIYKTYSATMILFASQNKNPERGENVSSCSPSFQGALAGPLLDRERAVSLHCRRGRKKFVKS